MGKAIFLPMLLASIAVPAAPVVAAGKTATVKAPSAVEKQVTAMIAEATTLANKGAFKDGLVIAAKAEALAQSAKPANPELRFEAARRYVILYTYSNDEAGIPVQFLRLAGIADAAFGRNSFAGGYSRFKAVQYQYGIRAPGVGLPQIAAAAYALADVAKSEEERTLAAQSLSVLANNTSLTDLAAAQPIGARAKAMADAMPNVIAAERAQIYIYLSSMALRSDRPADALAMVDTAIEIYKADQGSSSHHLVTAYGYKANAYRALGDDGKTNALLRQAIGLVDATPAMGGTYPARAYLDYARFLASQNQYALALPVVDTAVAKAAKLPPADSFTQTVALSAGKIYLDAGHPEEALVSLRHALDMIQAAGNTAMEPGALIQIARAEQAGGDLAGAEDTARTAVAKAEASTPAGHSLRGEARMMLADIVAARGDAPGAATLYAQAATELKEGSASATARIRLAAALLHGGTLDDGHWRDARAGGDVLIATLIRSAAQLGSERLTIPPTLLDASIDVAWARAATPAGRTTKLARLK